MTNEAPLATSHSPQSTIQQPVIRGVRFFLAHTPGLVRYGSKPSRDIDRDPAVTDTIQAHLRGYPDAVAYPPNQAFLGAIHPDALAGLPTPWFRHANGGERWAPHGEIMPEEEFYGWLKIADAFDLVSLEAGFRRVRPPRAGCPPAVHAGRPGAIGHGVSQAELDSRLAGDMPALPLFLRDGTRASAASTPPTRWTPRSPPTCCWRT